MKEEPQNMEVGSKKEAPQNTEVGSKKEAPQNTEVGSKREAPQKCEPCKIIGRKSWRVLRCQRVQERRCVPRHILLGGHQGIGRSCEDVG